MAEAATLVRLPQAAVSSDGPDKKLVREVEIVLEEDERTQPEDEPRGLLSYRVPQPGVRYYSF